MSYRSISLGTARRLAIVKQCLANYAHTPDRTGILETIRRLGCVQIDPINTVTRSHKLVLWSRLGVYDPAELEYLLWEERSLFEYWAHAASIVLTENYPIHQAQMQSFLSGQSAWMKRVQTWMEENESFIEYIFAELDRRGPLSSREIEDKSVTSWQSGGWTNNRNVSTMLGFLWERGDIMIARRVGIKKMWALTKNHLPESVNHVSWPKEKVLKTAVQISLRALGVATPDHIENHFIRGCYPNLDQIILSMEKDATIVPVQIENGHGNLPGPWYIHAEDLPLVEQIEAGAWYPRTTLLSPFDNLICNRERTKTLFNFDYRSEIYVPKAKRKYGYYVMPILHNGELVGRVDPKMDRKNHKLIVNAIHFESDVKPSPEMYQSIDDTLRSLGEFLGAKDIIYETTPFNL